MSVRCGDCGVEGRFLRSTGRGDMHTFDHAAYCVVGKVLAGAFAPRDEYEYLDGLVAPFEPGDYDGAA